MSTTQQDQGKSSGKPRQRGRKADQRGQKPEQQQGPKLDQRDEDQIAPMVASSDAPVNAEAVPADAPIVGEAAPPEAPLVGEVLPPDVRSIGAMAPANNFPVSIQAIANAYGDYSRKSFEESLSFVEKLVGVRSLDKAIELQTEFAKQAYANLVAESQKICELYGELAKQVFRPWERFAAVLTQSGRRP
jgi:phasin family protein